MEDKQRSQLQAVGPGGGEFRGKRGPDDKLADSEATSQKICQTDYLEETEDEYLAI